jgi:hypothetical protein
MRLTELSNWLMTWKTAGTLKAFKLAFNEWATSLIFHVEQEDKYVTMPLIQCTTSADDPSLELADKVKDTMITHEEEMHEELLSGLEDVFAVLKRTSVALALSHGPSSTSTVRS